MKIQTLEAADAEIAALYSQTQVQEDRDRIYVLECFVRDGGCLVLCDFQEQIQNEVDRLRRGEDLLLGYIPVVEALIRFAARSN
ncbi:hypothetical protein [Shimazuella kribbensis]|uniref:hypothetical protein n=1 Tax=Shimazuella kribbensis TaxID=139808 RepID=UPI00048D728F|nr:hypothetical protein [Shimazuella kribbensis]